jgi:hypothetical protein
MVSSGSMAQRPPRALYIPQQLPQESTCLHPVRQELASAIADCQNHDRSHERTHRQVPECPDMSAVMQALATVQSDPKTKAEMVQVITVRVHENTTTHQQIATLSRETNRTVMDAAEERRTTTAIIQETNDIPKQRKSLQKISNPRRPPRPHISVGVD